MTLRYPFPLNAGPVGLGTVLDVEVTLVALAVARIELELPPPPPEEFLGRYLIPSSGQDELVPMGSAGMN